MNTLRKLVTSTAAIAVAAAGAVSVAPMAQAMSAPIQTTATVNIRPTPDTSQTPVGAIPAGVSPDFVCWTQGQNIGGVDVWFKINYGGHTGYYASYYDNSSYATDATITSKYGIPQCGAVTPPPATPSARTQAVNWAASHVGQNYDSGLCLTFVFAAYSSAGVNLRSFVTVPIGSNTYPIDIWGHFNHGITGTGTPPYGALVFWASKTGNRTLSHVTMSLGNGQMVSTSDSLGSLVHYETVAQRSYSIELGWWLPV